RAPSFDRIGVVDRPAPLDEVIEPALPAVGRGLESDAGETTAVPHEKRQCPAPALRDEVLDVHLLDLVDTIRVELGGHAAGRKHDLLYRLPRNRVLAPADVKRAHFL